MSEPASMAPTLRTGTLLLLLALAWCTSASLAHAQGDARPPIPALPGGDGLVVGQLEHPNGASAAAGANVVLYGLAADGAPGVRDTIADANGRFRFEDVSTAEGAVYLLGARHAGVPFFGPRVSFSPGQRELRVRLAVSDPSRDRSALTLGESRTIFEWGGTEVQVLESHRVGARGDQVLFVPEDTRAGGTPLLSLSLPDEARDFQAVAPSTDDAFTRSGTRLDYWGPVYPGDPTQPADQEGASTQDLRFAYSLALPPTSTAGSPGEGRAPLSVAFPRPAEGATTRFLLVPEAGGLTLEAAGLVAVGRETLGDRPYRSFRWDMPERVASLSIGVPSVDTDASQLGLTQANFWVEADDIATTVNAELHLRSAARSHLVGSSQAPVVTLPLPRDAELLGLSPNAQSMGALPMESAIGLVGPIPPGDTVVSLRFRLPTAKDGAPTALSLSVPIEAPVVNVLVADSGVRVESERLHRRRAFRSGTRTYLHREAYRIEANEPFVVTLTPTVRTHVSGPVLASGTVLAMAAAAFFLFTPLRSAREREDAAPEASEWALRRAAVVQDIRDLDHDFETGKIGQADYDELRAGLRADAIELLRREEAGRETGASDPAAQTAAADRSPCPQCGAPSQPQWAFCAKCGAPLAGSA